MSEVFVANKFGQEPERPETGLGLFTCHIGSPAAAMGLDTSALSLHLVCVADVLNQGNTASVSYVIREAVRRMHEQHAEIERLKFHARALRKASTEAAENLRQLVEVSETPGARLQHVVFALASALATSRNLQL